MGKARDSVSTRDIVSCCFLRDPKVSLMYLTLHSAGHYRALNLKTPYEYYLQWKKNRRAQVSRMS